MEVSARLSSKGQVTVPRAVREALSLKLEVDPAHIVEIAAKRGHRLGRRSVDQGRPSTDRGPLS